MDEQTTPDDVQYPIFGDSGSSVERSLDREVKGQRGVGDFDGEIQIAGLGPPFPKARKLTFQNDDIGYGLTARVIFWSYVDGSLAIDKARPKDLDEPT
jgi:hypothetical protein